MIGCSGKVKEDRANQKEWEGKCMLCRGHHDGNNHDGEPKEEFDFGAPAEEAEGSMEKAKTQKWSDVVRGLKPEVKSEGTNSDKSWNESETADSDQQMDPDESDQLEAKETRTQRKSMPSRRNRRIGKRRGRSSEGAEMGLLNRHADQQGRGAQNQKGSRQMRPDRTRSASKAERHQKVLEERTGNQRH